ncbi:MAG: glycosyltransferase family 4 protein [Fuerstiella sp.]|nr:glycosyltransferase family 4 protein [Fuerstiella sp.]
MASSDTDSFENDRILFLTEFLPLHQGHGGNVYPYFVLDALRKKGIRHLTILSNPIEIFRKPWSQHYGSFKSVNWKRLGNLQVSVSPKDWIRFGCQGVRRVCKGISKYIPTLSHTRRVQGSKASLCTSESTRVRSPLPKALTRYLLSLEPHVLMVNFPYLIDSLPDEVCQHHFVIVLTHELIHERVVVYQQHNWKLDFEPLSISQEHRLLSKANLVVAISKHDEEKLKSVLPNTPLVTCFPPIFEGPVQFPQEPDPNVIEADFLFVGSGAVHNCETIRWILEEIWPSISEQYPRMRLNIVGSVCDYANTLTRDATVRLLGRVPEIDQAYQDVDLAFAFAVGGAGVKMKILEALRFGVPAMATEETLRGLPDGARDVFPMVESFVDVLNFIRSLSSRTDALLTLRQQQQNWANQHLSPDRLIQPLLDSLPVS